MAAFGLIFNDLDSVVRMGESLSQTPPLSTSTPRFLFIDGLRGVAASMVVISHFTVAGAQQSDPFIKAFSPVIIQALGSGKLGVEIFFVISGFVIAFSQRGTAVTPKYFLNFAIRRSFRLDPAYWFAILMEIVLLVVSHRVGAADTQHPLPSTAQVLSHLVYLQHLLRYDDIIPVLWTLCLEVQFYLFYTLFRWLGQLVPVGPGRSGIEGSIMAGLAVYSLAIFCGWTPDPLVGFFVKYWFMFFLGVTLWWTLSMPGRAAYFYGMWLVGAVSLVVHFNGPIVVVLATGGLIFFAARTNRLRTWLSSRVVQFLGRISYSLYLIHLVVGMRTIRYGTRFTGATVLTKMFWIGIATALSIGVATLMYQCIEYPFMQLSKRLQGVGWKNRPGRVI